MDKKDIPYLENEFQFGMHACGAICGITFTNSLESLKYWYNRGIRLFEVDIDGVGNGEFVACHDFTKETFHKMEIEDMPPENAYEWFKKQKLYKNTTQGLTPMTLENIFELLCSHTDILFMFDPKIYSYNEICLLLSKTKYYIKRFGVDGKKIIFELYNDDMIMAAKGFKGMVQYQYCVDDEMQMGTSEKMRKWELDKTIEFLKENDIEIVSYPWKFAVENLEKVKRLKEEKFVIFSKTKNNILADLLKKAGVNVNLIDYLVTDEQREELQIYKNEYFDKYKDKIDRILC